MNEDGHVAGLSRSRLGIDDIMDLYAVVGGEEFVCKSWNGLRIEAPVLLLGCRASIVFKRERCRRARRMHTHGELLLLFFRRALGESAVSEGSGAGQGQEVGQAKGQAEAAPCDVA